MRTRTSLAVASAALPAGPGRPTGRTSTPVSVRLRSTPTPTRWSDMAKDEGFQPPTQGPIFGQDDPDQTGQYAVSDVEVPEGSVSEVTAWIGNDKSRAEAVIKSEG